MLQREERGLATSYTLSIVRGWQVVKRGEKEREKASQ
jgi:hypothetical protein